MNQMRHKMFIIEFITIDIIYDNKPKLISYKCPCNEAWGPTKGPQET